MCALHATPMHSVFGGINFVDLVKKNHQFTKFKSPQSFRLYSNHKRLILDQGKACFLNCTLCNPYTFKLLILILMGGYREGGNGVWCGLGGVVSW